MQLVVRRTSWWEDLHIKQAAAVWIPVAVAQAGTLAAAGYLYQRLEHLEQQTASAYRPPVLGNVLRDADVSVPPARVTRVPPPPPPAFPAAVPVQVALDNPATLDVMRVGQDFSRVPSTPVARLAGKPAVRDVAPSSGKVRISEPPADLDGGRTADANRASVGVRVASAAAHTVVVEPAVSLAEDIVFVPESAAGAVEAEAVQAPVVSAAPVAGVADTVTDAAPAEVAPLAVPRGNPLPVGFESWVYLGELRPHGWHGQRLHVAPDSGLPEVGNSYHTQELHGLYSRPHGNRAMGGFQQGDLVTILEVQHEANQGVWAKVRKAEAVGRHNNR